MTSRVSIVQKGGRWVWRDEGGRVEHILIDSKEDKDGFMAVILGLHKKEVVGHRFTDSTQEYGLREL